MKKPRRKILREGFCEECHDHGMLTLYKNKYICRDCFVGEYEESYVKQRLEQITAGKHAITQIQNGEHSVIRSGKRRNGAQ